MAVPWYSVRMPARIESQGLKGLSRETVKLFAHAVPKAEVNVADALANFVVDGVSHSVRIKRAKSMANQIQVWRGEPLVIHVPSKNGDRWYVLPVSWQMTYARKNANTAKQHASHAYDCMMIAARDLPSEHEVTLKTLRAACEKAVREASSRQMRGLVKAITRARSAVANALIESFEEDFFEQ